VSWDALLAVTHPGVELEVGADRWLILRRAYQHPDTALNDHDDRMVITVELVRSGSPADPRTGPTPPREDT
jgi:hypothetical protein